MRTHDPSPTTAEWGYLTCAQVLDGLERGEFTSVDLVTSLLARVKALDGGDTDTALHAIAGISPDAVDVARERDDERRRGEVRGRLHGVPVAIKDNIEAAGLPGLAGSTSLVGRPARDAELVQRLRAAGAIVWASTNLSEWANIRSPYSTSGWSASGGLVANPWALERSAGGSSSGAGASAAGGYGPLFVGTETDGSITCPASLHGVSGLKPTVGHVSRDGVVPISSSQDSPGPIARDVDSVARLYQVLSGRDDDGLAEPRVAAALTWPTAHPATDALFAEVVQALREQIDVGEVSPAWAGPQERADELTVMLCELKDNLGQYLRNRAGTGVSSLADVVIFEEAHADVEMPYFGHEFLEQSLATGGMASQEYLDARARNVTWALQTCLEPIFTSTDVVVAAAYPPAWKSDFVNGDQLLGSSGSIGAAAIAGWPIAAVPMGLVGGLPVAMTLIGRPGSEWTLLNVARRVETLVASRGYAVAPTWQQPSRG